MLPFAATLQTHYGDSRKHIAHFEFFGTSLFSKGAAGTTPPPHEKDLWSGRVKLMYTSSDVKEGLRFLEGESSFKFGEVHKQVLCLYRCCGLRGASFCIILSEATLVVLLD